jgi:hypothetical protein
MMVYDVSVCLTCSLYIGVSYRHAKNYTLDNAGLDKSCEAGLSLLTLETKSLFDLLVFSENLWVVHVTTAVEAGQNLESLLPTVLGGEPTRRAREEEETDEQDGAGDGLDAPRNAESCRALSWVADTSINEGAAVLNEVLDQDTPGLGT